jgi:hypothetical protein
VASAQDCAWLHCRSDRDSDRPVLRARDVSKMRTGSATGNARSRPTILPDHCCGTTRMRSCR